MNIQSSSHPILSICTMCLPLGPWKAASLLGQGMMGAVVPSGRTRRAERRQRLGQATAFCLDLNRNEIHPEESWGKFGTRASVNNAECRWVRPHLVTKTILFPRLVSSAEKSDIQVRSNLKGNKTVGDLKRPYKTNRKNLKVSHFRN